MRLVFVHGWALGPEIWDAVSPLLESYAQARVNLGYFGGPCLPDPLPGDVLVGHSAGLLWGLKQRPDWAGVVAINSFSRFCLDEQGRGCVKPAALRAMRANLARNADECVRSFRHKIGAPSSLAAAQPAPLADGLEILRSFDAAPYLGGAPVLALAAKDDALAPPGEATNLARVSGASLVFSESGGHGLPWTAPGFCAKVIAAFLNDHDL